MRREADSMQRECRQSGSVLLVVVVLVALLAATVVGHLQVNAEEIQLMQNHVHGAEAMALAEAGLNDALAKRSRRFSLDRRAGGQAVRQWVLYGDDRGHDNPVGRNDVRRFLRPGRGGRGGFAGWAAVPRSDR